MPKPHLLRNVLVPMPDGVRLAADVYLPDANGRYPAVFYFGPYRKDDYIVRNGSMTGLPEIYTARGYALVIADVRGTNDSEGLATVMFSAAEQRDGFEMVEWIAAQDWCDGNVGMTGISYGFFTSVLTAAQRPPHLRAIVPIHGSVSWFYCINEGGAPMTFGYHANYVALMISMQGAPPGYRGPDWRELWRNRVQTMIPWGIDWFGRQKEDEYFDACSLETCYDRIEVPVFAIDGWWDRYANDPFKIYENVRAPVKILLGPWQHTRMDIGIPGPRVSYDVLLRWFDHWLKGEPNGVMDEPRVTYFAQQYSAPADYRAEIPGEWRATPKWPVPGTQWTNWYAAGGTLSPETPRKSGKVEFSYDPAAGACSRLSGGIYGGIGMPLDQRPDEPASVVFTSRVLDRSLEVTGIPHVRLRFSSTATRMNVIAKLCDVAPDGVVALITRGYLNVAHREGQRRPRILTPGVAYDLDFEMKATSYVFEPGHQIRLTVTSAEFPSMWPTPELGVNTLYFGPDVGSCLMLPVVPPGVAGDAAASLRILPPPPPEMHGRSFTVSDDGGAGCVRADLAATETFPGVDCSIEHSSHTWTRVDRSSPAQAIAEAESVFRFDYQSGEQIESRGWVRCEGESEAVSVKASLDVTLNGETQFRGDWSFSYPRDFI